ncbi:MAG: hypothetical protein V4484_21485 [Pseudomonadota bacterium]
MNSIDDVDAMLGALFDEVLMPMAQKMREAGVDVFPRAPDVSWLSYYVRRKRSVMIAADFSSASCSDVDEFEQRLAAHWLGLGRHGLVAQAARFASIARVARQAQADVPAKVELSPYVYAMF